MTASWWLGTGCVVVYLGLGAVVAPGITAQIERGHRRSRRPRGDRLAVFLTTTATGRLAVVLLWPVLAWLAHWGFLFGLWDWRGETSDTDRR